MGIVSKLISLVRGNMNDALDKANNPVKTLNLKIEDMNKSMLDLKLANSEVSANIKKLDAKIEIKKAEVAELEKDIEFEIKKGNEELAKTIVIKKLDKEGMIKTLEDTRDNLQIQLSQSKKNYTDIEAVVEKMKMDKDALSLRYTTASLSKKLASAQIKDAIEGTDVKSLEEKVIDVEFEAEALKEEIPIKVMESGYSNRVIESELDKYRE